MSGAILNGAGKNDRVSIDVAPVADADCYCASENAVATDADSKVITMRSLLAAC